MLKQLLNLLFPTKCIICDQHHSQNEICPNCWSKLTFITNPSCAICSTPFEYETNKETICGNCIINKPNYDHATSLLKYDEHSKKLISRFKYQDQLHILNYFVNLMINLGKEIIKDTDIISPVAMHKYKLLKRGFNQSALLAMRLSTKTKIKYIPQLLIKTTNVKAQVGLKREERLHNVKNSFIINPLFKGKIKGKKILLIDDVITTGATINECCHVLRKEQPAKIFILTIAKRI